MSTKILEYLSPDLYLRYHYGFEIIKNFQKDKFCKILDVGGKSGIMGDMIKKEKLPYTLTVIDSLPDDVIKTTVCDKYIQQDFLEFETTTKFDYLVTFDVLEHVHDKEVFINKCLSLCDSLIISAPFKSEITSAAENIVDQYFLKYKGVHHPWLKEHFEQGLPDLSWLKSKFDSCSIKYQVIESNNIENWVNFMLPNQLPSIYKVNTRNLNKVNKFYNQNHIILGDKKSPTYRKLFVTMPKGYNSLSKKYTTQNHEIDVQKRLIFISMILDLLTEEGKVSKELLNKYQSII